MAEGEGFEPPVPFRVQWFSRPPPSTTRPSLRPRNSRTFSELRTLGILRRVRQDTTFLLMAGTISGTAFRWSVTTTVNAHFRDRKRLMEGRAAIIRRGWHHARHARPARTPATDRRFVCLRARSRVGRVSQTGNAPGQGFGANLMLGRTRPNLLLGRRRPVRSAAALFPANLRQILPDGVFDLLTALPSLRLGQARRQQDVNP